MTDPFSWSLHLGRWAGVQVRVHVLLLAFVLLELLDASLAEVPNVPATAGWLLLLVAALALHELAHWAVAVRLDLDPDDVRLWPLGNLVGPAPTSSGGRSAETAMAAGAGIVASGLLAIGSAIALNLGFGARMVFNPLGGEFGGAPLLADGKTFAAAFTPAWWVGWFGYLNWVLFLANLIPALPLDMGRVLRALTESPWGSGSRDKLIGYWTARVSALLLGLCGLLLIFKGTVGGLTLILLGVFIYLIARQEAHMLEEGSYFDDTLFGYDFSQGYTSLEANPAAVRPRREGSLARWRRRRSEQRRLRQEARAAAEEARMDEILAKIHREGRSALTSEENRFLVRVSAKYKDRARSRH